jgi:Tfp pilus assembly protein FimT
MKKILAVLALSAFSGVVFAQDTISTSTTESNSTSGSISGAVSEGSNVTVNFPGQPAETTQNVNYGGGTTNTNNNNTNVTGTTTSNVAYTGETTQNVVSSGSVKNEVRYSGSYKTVPNVYAPPVGVTAPCIVGWSAGISVIGVGVSAGNGVEDKECTNRENARMLHAFGEVKGAVSLLCQNKNVLKAMSERCALAMANELPTPQPTAEPVVIKDTPKYNHKHDRKHSHKKVTE